MSYEATCSHTYMASVWPIFLVVRPRRPTKCLRWHYKGSLIVLGGTRLLESSGELMCLSAGVGLSIDIVT